jgi:AraC-like DNA-binding protein
MTAVSIDRLVLAVCLEQTRLRLVLRNRVIFDGAMSPGALWLNRPGDCLTADFEAPCDFIHVHVTEEAWGARCAAFGAASGMRGADSVIVRDALVEQLARSLVSRSGAGSAAYATTVADAVIGRRLLLATGRKQKVQALAKWRLRRVQTHIEENLAGRLQLADLAQVAGLSRMHFAGQFRAATGYRPHEYLLWRRIEKAKTMLRSPNPSLVQIALEVGFQAQTHFTTVFKRLTGNTPAAWRGAHLEGRSDQR